MARTTAPYLGPKDGDRCHHCHSKAEATVSGTAVKTGEEITFRICLEHANRYVRNWAVTVVADPEARVALCACKKFVGHNGRAAHRCSAAA